MLVAIGMLLPVASRSLAAALASSFLVVYFRPMANLPHRAEELFRRADFGVSGSQGLIRTSEATNEAGRAAGSYARPWSVAKRAAAVREVTSSLL
jgi:hypothetical protein